jgi:hypothetical protein
MTASRPSTWHLRTWLLVAACVAIVVFQGWLAITVIGDLGMPGWDYRPVRDVPGESPYTLTAPYHALPFPQHVSGKQGEEDNPLRILNLYETYQLSGEAQ